MVDKNKKIKMVIGCVLFSLLLIVGLIFATDSNVFIVNTKCLWILGFFYLFVFLYSIFSNMVKDMIREQNSIFLLLGGSVVVSILIMCILPFQYSKVLTNNILEKKLLQSEKIAIEPLNEKNENSAGCAVCIEGVVLDGEDYNMYEMTLAEGWEFVDGRPYTEGNAGKLVIDVSKSSEYGLLVRKNNVSGKVKVYIDNDSEIFDLYSEEAVDREKLELSLILGDQVKKEKAVEKEIIYYICYFVIIFLMIVSADAYYFKYKNRKVREDI